MDKHARSYEIVKPTPGPPHQPSLAAQPSHDRPTIYQKQWTSTSTRPLSDIRELSEPSVLDNLARKPGGEMRHYRNGSKAKSVMRDFSGQGEAPSRPMQPQAAVAYDKPLFTESASSSYSSTPPEPSSYYGIPRSSVPRRSSSQNHGQRPGWHRGRNPSLQSPGPLTLAPAPTHSYTIPNRGQSSSPVREACLKADPVTSDAARRIPFQTHVRNPHSSDILDYPSCKHPRLRLDIHVTAPVFVGGGTIEGQVKIVVDDNERLKHRRSLSIGTVSVDLIGFEDMSSNRKSAFLALGTEVIDANHLPPSQMTQPSNTLCANDAFWSLAPSSSSLPFVISLPLDTGPPPFQSKYANIRFLLCVTAFVRDAGKHYRVRTSQDVHVLPTFDPEKALTSLPSPLIASDELSMPRARLQESLKVTAGLHRQVWVSGSSIFVDVHVANKCRKAVRKLELALERNILCYKHAAATTLEKSASQARIFESNDQTILARSSSKQSTLGWNGVEPHATETRTCELEVPRGHATVRCGKYFEVRYFLNVIASLSSSKSVSVQLPIILIHMNSLDVVPNSVAQVAAAIEEKRSRRQIRHQRSRSKENHARARSLSSLARTTDIHCWPAYTQGRAFAAPRQQSLERRQEQKADMELLCNTLDSSPRKYQPRQPQPVRDGSLRKFESNVSLKTVKIGYPESYEGLGIGGVMSYHTPPRAPAVRTFDHVSANENSEPLRGRLRRMRSFESIISKRSITPGRTPKVREPPAQIVPHALGLTANYDKIGFDAPSDRLVMGPSFREKLDRSRFEFKAVRRKASGSLKERSMNWWDQRKGKDRECWI